MVLSFSASSDLICLAVTSVAAMIFSVGTVFGVTAKCRPSARTCSSSCVSDLWLQFLTTLLGSRVGANFRLCRLLNVSKAVLVRI